jgi:uncharacterized protein YdaU (DUF1376 family)
MSKDPAILFYTSDFLSGTAFFSDEQRGQYIRLLCEQHQNGHIPERHMINICQSNDSPVFKKFKKDPDGLYFQERMDKEIQKRSSYSESRRNNRFGKKDIKDMSSHMSNHMSNHMDNGNENENENISKEEKVKEEKKPVSVKLDYQFIVDNYHHLCPKMNKVAVITDQRKGFMNSRVTEFGLDTTISILRKAGESDFLNGINDKAWMADFEWLLRPQNFIKVMEGKFVNKNGQNRNSIATIVPTLTTYRGE